MHRVPVAWGMMDEGGDVFLGSKATVEDVQYQVFMALLFVCKSLLKKCWKKRCLVTV